VSGHIFKKLMDPDEARKAIITRFEPVEDIEEVPIEEALNRVLAVDLEAPIDLPPYTRSLRDGYAVRSVDISNAREDRPVRLRLKGFIEAGSWPEDVVGEGEAIYVATGAPIPPGADTVVMEEYTERMDSHIDVFHYSPPGEWIQNAGSDVSMGETVFDKGVLIGPREIGILSGLGIDKVPVYRRMKAVVISSGDEVVEPGVELSPGEIYDVNGYSISAALQSDGCEAKVLGIARDDEADIRRLLLSGLEEGDIVVFSGATSVGIKDMLRDVLMDIEGTTILFDGLRIKPGKPTMAAEVGGKLFIGLPGFPVSSLMVYLYVFSPVVRALNRLPQWRVAIKAKTGSAIDSVFGVVHLHPVFLKQRGGVARAYPIKTDSGAIATLRLADGYAVIPDNQNYMEIDEDVEIMLFPGVSPSNVVSFSSHSIAFDKLARLVYKELGVKIKRIYVGSNASLKYTSEGFSDMGVIHLLSREGVYNIPFVEGVGGVALFHGFWREIGLVVGRGNPHGIKSIEDIVDRDVRFINRVVGSGIRVYIDLQLEKISGERGVDTSKLIDEIFGYNVEARTHTAVVKAVERGLYDVGVASRLSTVGREVDFIPLTWERVDFIFNMDSVSERDVSRVIDVLSSKEARELLSSLPGIRVDKKYFTRLI